MSVLIVVLLSFDDYMGFTALGIISLFVFLNKFFQRSDFYISLISGGLLITALGQVLGTEIFLHTGSKFVFFSLLFFWLELFVLHFLKGVYSSWAMKEP